MRGVWVSCLPKLVLNRGVFIVPRLCWFQRSRPWIGAQLCCVPRSLFGPYDSFRVWVRIDYKICLAYAFVWHMQAIWMRLILWTSGDEFERFLIFMRRCSNIYWEYVVVRVSCRVYLIMWIEAMQWAYINQSRRCGDEAWARADWLEYVRLLTCARRGALWARNILEEQWDTYWGTVPSLFGSCVGMRLLEWR